ncbi:hypothetical protein [Pontiella agarivorans]|uniref:Uncharacterized protein n=1 Tax=Pontiella agarivorans TaxID=3038953 RepID=A0ABU5MVS0_9BACT|nr:hypothetical protein [Pontiella agarivorans]MDZ8118267.1 hypothetical protein [Pontiella agarivorans]
MTLKYKILTALLVVSVVANIFQWLIMKDVFVVNSKIEFSYPIPQFTEAQESLIKHASPQIAKYIPTNYYIYEIEETDEQIIFHFSTLSRLRDYHLSTTGYSGGRFSQTFDGTFTMIFDKEMSLQKLEDSFGNEIPIE